MTLLVSKRFNSHFLRERGLDLDEVGFDIARKNKKNTFSCCFSEVSTEDWSVLVPGT
jgi:hypothetical protein